MFQANVISDEEDGTQTLIYVSGDEEVVVRTTLPKGEQKITLTYTQARIISRLLVLADQEA